MIIIFISYQLSIKEFILFDFLFSIQTISFKCHFSLSIPVISSGTHMKITKK